MAEKFTPMDQRAYDHLKAIHTASHTFSRDRTINRTIRGFEMGALREARVEGRGQLAGEIFEEGRKLPPITINGSGAKI